MTQEEQRIAIAEACGWDLGIMHVCHCGDSEKNHTWEHGFVPMLYLKDLPDYLNDLNAMHEAEKTLTRDKRVKFVRQLCGVVGLTWRPTSHFDTIHATAAQRAEAFLRTIGGWKEAV